MPSIERDAKSEPMPIGFGFNSISGRLGGRVLDYVDTDMRIDTPIHNRPGQSVSYGFEEITRFSSVERRMSRIAAARLGRGIFQAEAASSFGRSFSLTQFNTNLLIDVDVVNSISYLDGGSATQDALTSKASIQAFLAYCGDGIVYAHQSGGRLTAVVQFSSKYVEDFQATQEQVGLAVKAWGSGAMDLSSAIRSMERLSGMSIRLVRTGGIGSIPTLDALAAAVSSFPDKVSTDKGNPWIQRILTRDYNAYPALMPSELSYLDLDDINRKLSTIADFLDRAYEAGSDFRFIVDNPDLFENPLEIAAKARDAFTQTEVEIQRLLGTAAAIQRDGTTPLPAPPLLPQVPAVRRTKPVPIVTARPTVVTLFEADNFQGASRELTESVTNLVNLDFNDVVSSWAVYGAPGEYRVEFFVAADFRDLAFEVTSPSSASNMRFRKEIGGTPFEFSFNDHISSVRITKMR